MNKLTQILAIYLTFLFTANVEASMRCSSGKFASENDKTFEVLVKCGKPNQRENFGLVTIDRDRVNLERWTYAPKKGKFIKYLEFHNGILKEISTGPRVE